MRRWRFWHSMWIITSAAVVPPMGLLLLAEKGTWLAVPSILLPVLAMVSLWRSPRSHVKKSAITFMMVVLAAGVGIGAMRSSVYGLVPPAEVPESGYNITLDSRNRYVDPRILKEERAIFQEVMKETERLRKEDPFYEADPASVESESMALPEGRAFKIVADRRYMDVEEVAGIYRKVTMQLRPRKR